MPMLKKRKGEKPAQQAVRSAVTEMKSGKLHSGSKTGPKVTNPKQAVAIGLSQARKKAGSPKKGGFSKGGAAKMVAKAKAKSNKDAHRRKRNLGRS